MLSFFSEKWRQAKEAVFQAIKYSLLKKEGVEQPVFYRILCVDDDQSFCQFIQRLANSLGIQVDAVYSVEEAKQAIENHPQYEAFIIDGHLPDGSGFEIVAWIREKKDLRTPIGFISRIYQDSTSFRILKETLEVNYVLEKPIRPSEAHQLLVELCQLTSTSTSKEPFSDLLLADLKADYESTISDKIERLEKMILAIQNDPSIENLQNLKKEAHKIAGSAGSYGYMAVSELCKNLELNLNEQIELARREKLDYQWLFSLDDFFTQIKLHFQIELIESDAQSVLKARHLPSIYVVDEEVAFLNHLKQPFPDLHFDILTETRPEKAIQTLMSADIYPEMLLFNTHYTSSVLTGYELLKAFYQKNEYLATTMALIVENLSLDDQIEALKRGMTFILSKPLPIPFILPLLDQASFRSLPLPYKILVIDDDLDICQYIVKTLKYTGLEIKTLQDIRDLEKTVMLEKPDLILLDVNLTDESGAEILTKLRKELGYKKLLVGMLAVTQQETYLIQKCYEADIQELLFKPLEGGMLQRKIAYLLKKEAEKTVAVKQPVIEGLENAETLKHYLNELQRHMSDSLPRSLVLFEVEGFASLNSKRKQAVLTHISQILEELLRKYEMAAYLDEGRFALVFQGYDPHFIQFFIRPFLLLLQSQLAALLENEALPINEVLVPLMPKKKAVSLLEKGEELLNSVKQSFAEQPVRMQIDPSIPPPKEVWIFHDETDNLDFLKGLFEEHSFRVFSKLEEEVPSNSIPWPIVILSGSWVSAKGLRLLKKLSFHQLQIPVLLFSQSIEEDYLHRFFNETHYFEAPFSFVLFLGKS